MEIPEQNSYSHAALENSGECVGAELADTPEGEVDGLTAVDTPCSNFVIQLKQVQMTDDLSSPIKQVNPFDCDLPFSVQSPCYLGPSEVQWPHVIQRHSILTEKSSSSQPSSRRESRATDISSGNSCKCVIF